MKQELNLWGWLGSTKLSCVVLLFLLLLTFLGTLAQVNLGLYETQRVYFDSWWFLQPVFGYEVLPLPGGVLLMSLMFVNLMVGGVIRMRHSWSRAGVLVAHLGIAMILVSGFVKFVWSEEGGLRLNVGETADEYGSYHEWEVAIGERLADGGIREYLVPGAQFRGLGADSVTFGHAELGFEMTLQGLIAHCQPRPVAPGTTPSNKVVDEFYLAALEALKVDESNISGCYATVRDVAAGTSTEGILWGGAHYPWTVEVGGRELGISLRKKRIALPFQVTLSATDRELFPGSMKPKSYSSEVVMTDGDVVQPTHIEMNQPLRNQGIVMFQSGWGEADARTGQKRFSYFAVVRNPSDDWPLWSCIVITIGLLMHYSRNLYFYIRQETQRHS